MGISIETPALDDSPARRIVRESECQLIIFGTRHRGFLVNFSETGLLIETKANPPIGETIDIRMQDCLRGTRIYLRARVVRRQPDEPRRNRSGLVGLGLEIVKDSPEFGEFLVRHLPNEICISPWDRAYRVTVILSGTTRKRELTIIADTETEARINALNQLNGSWEINRVIEI